MTVIDAVVSLVQSIEGGVTMKLSRYWRTAPAGGLSGQETARRQRCCRDHPERSFPPWLGTCPGIAGSDARRNCSVTLPSLSAILASTTLRISLPEYLLRGRHRHRRCWEAQGLPSDLPSAVRRQPAQKPLHLNSRSGVRTGRPAVPAREDYKSLRRSSPWIVGAFAVRFTRFTRSGHSARAGVAP